MTVILVTGTSMGAPAQPEPLRPAGRSFNPAPKTPAPPVSKRAREIRRQIWSNLVWGGVHSPFPQRILTMRTIDAMRPRIKHGDEEALCELLLDEDIRIYSAATHLLNDLTPDALDIVQERLGLASAKYDDEYFSLLRSFHDLQSLQRSRTSGATAPANR